MGRPESSRRRRDRSPNSSRRDSADSRCNSPDRKRSRAKDLVSPSRNDSPDTRNCDEEHEKISGDKSPPLSNSQRNAKLDPSFQDQRNALPVGQYKKEILKAIADNQIIICVGETGSGKTTQIPQFLHEAGYSKGGKKIGITQPRRVATIAVAKRVAEEMNERVGSTIGYTIRFDDHTGPDTTLKFMTDGILVRECLHQKELDPYSVIMLDEAHERSIHTDILFGLMKEIIQKRKDLKLVVTSATLDVKKFSKYFGDCPVITVPGRTFPVDIYHSKQHQVMGKSGPISKYVQAAVDTTLKIHESEDEGHILVFLTGQNEIDDACDAIEKGYNDMRDNTRLKLIVYPLYGALQGHQQSRVFDRVYPDERKVIVATNIAETSLTVDGIRFVVDAGFVKQKVYNPTKGMESLVVVPISKVSAKQRSGRAGRTSAGKCFRLYSKESYAENMFEETIPEIQRCNLINTILYLKAIGVNDVLGFDFLDRPEEDLIFDALMQLYMLGAINEKGSITDLGLRISKFPLDPRLSRTLIEALELGCEQEVVKIIALLSVEQVFLRETSRYSQERNLKHLMDERGDHFTLLAVFNEWEKTGRDRNWCKAHSVSIRSLNTASSIMRQLKDLISNVKPTANSKSDKKQRRMKVSHAISRSFCAGFFMNGARRVPSADGVYRGLSGEYKLVHVHPSSIYSSRRAMMDTRGARNQSHSETADTDQQDGARPPDYAVFHELIYTSKGFMRQILSVREEWLKLYSVEIPTVDMLHQLSGRSAPISNFEKAPVQTKETAEQKKKKLVEKTNAKVSALEAAKARYLERKRQLQ